MRQKNLWKKLLFPPIWLILLFCVVSAILLVAVFTKHLETHPVAYVIYVISFYTVSALTIFCVVTVPGKVRKIKAWFRGTSFGNRYVSDVSFKNRVSLYLTLAINLLYAGANALLFALQDSMWFVILAIYYGMLAFLRFLLLHYSRAKKEHSRKGELHLTTVCAVVLSFVNVILSGAVLMILFAGKGFFYHEIFIYVVALYTFYVTIYAVVNVIRYRKYNSPAMLMAKIIALSAALVSMLSLETAMLSQFGKEMEQLQKNIMIAATGGGVSILILLMSVYMVLKSVSELKKLRSEQNGAERT